MNSIVRSIDVGYGSVKFVVSTAIGQPLSYRSFPSLVAHPPCHDLSGGVIADRDTTIVEVEGIAYEVGPQVELALGTQAVRILNKDYTSQREYLALLYGALQLMNTPEIDQLVVGLPVSLLATKATALKFVLEGPHNTSHCRSVYVNRALVLAQPIGGLIDFASSCGDYEKLRRTNNLIIDIGFYTLDWVVSRGIQPIPARCGSFSGGMHAVVQRLAQALSAAFRIDFDDYTTLDRGLREGVLRIYGEDLALADYLPAVQPAVDAAVNALINSVGDGRDLDNVVLVGGGAAFFRSAIEHRFPSHQIQIASEPAFANVRGFQRAGEEMLRRKGVALA